MTTQQIKKDYPMLIINNYIEEDNLEALQDIFNFGTLNKTLYNDIKKTNDKVLKTTLKKYKKAIENVMDVYNIIDDENQLYNYFMGEFINGLTSNNMKQILKTIRAKGYALYLTLGNLLNEAKYKGYTQNIYKYISNVIKVMNLISIFDY